MDVIHKRRPQVAATTLALNSFSWPRKGTNEVSIKPGPKSCVQGGWVTRSSLTTPHSNSPSLKTLATQFFLGSFGLSVSQQFGLPPNGRTDLSEVPEPRPNGGLVPLVGMCISDRQLRASYRRNYFQFEQSFIVRNASLADIHISSIMQMVALNQ